MGDEGIGEQADVGSSPKAKWTLNAASGTSPPTAAGDQVCLSWPPTEAVLLAG